MQRSFPSPYHKIFQALVPGAPRARSNPEETTAWFPKLDKVEGRCPADPVLPEVWRDAARAGDGSSSTDFRPPLTSDSPSRSRPRAPKAGR